MYCLETLRRIHCFTKTSICCDLW